MGQSDRMSMFCEVPPETEFRDDLAHVTYRVGGVVFEFVMVPSTFYSALLAALELNAKWRVRNLEGNDIVVPITKGGH